MIWDARKKFVIFDPEVLHATQQRRGFRIAVTAYSSRMVTRLSQQRSTTTASIWFPTTNLGPIFYDSGSRTNVIYYHGPQAFGLRYQR